MCPEERAVAIETGSNRVAATLRWLHRRRFMSPLQLQRFASVVGRLTESLIWLAVIEVVLVACPCLRRV